MNIESQVCALEYAKKFKELGVKQESLFSYSEEPWILKEDKILETRIFIRASDYSYDWQRAINKWSAYTVAELSKIIPLELESDDKYHPYDINIKWELHYSDNKMWHVTYKRYNDEIFKDFIIYDINLSNVMAKMLIYLIENGLVKVEDINANL